MFYGSGGLIMDKQSLEQAYFDFLKEEGYVPEIDGDGDIVFKYQGDKYWIDIDEQDLEFFRLCYLGDWPCETDDEKLKLYKAASKTNAEMKLAKVSILDGEAVWGSIEILTDQPSGVKKYFKRMLKTLHDTIDEFQQNMHETDEKQADGAGAMSGEQQV
jgi:hypothetical protein